MFFLAKVHDEIVVDMDNVRGFEEKSTEPLSSIVCGILRGPTQADPWGGGSAVSAVTEVILMLMHC